MAYITQCESNKAFTIQKRSYDMTNKTEEKQGKLGITHSATWFNDKTEAVHITYDRERGVNICDLSDFWGCEVDEVNICDMSAMDAYNVKFGSDAEPIHFGD